jgi:cytochrome b involved in lipid metabolism
MLCFRKKYPKFTRDEVNKHYYEESCYIIANNKVYDITKLLDKHPYSDILLLNKSKTGENCYEDYYFHNNKKKWKKYFIGYII